MGLMFNLNLEFCRCSIYFVTKTRNIHLFSEQNFFRTCKVSILKLIAFLDNIDTDGPESSMRGLKNGRVRER
jgi:hypothetical protein